MAALVTELAVGITWSYSTAVATEEFDGGWIRRCHSFYGYLFASLEEGSVDVLLLFKPSNCNIQSLYIERVFKEMPTSVKRGYFKVWFILFNLFFYVCVCLVIYSNNFKSKRKFGRRLNFLGIFFEFKRYIKSENFMGQK